MEPKTGPSIFPAVDVEKTASVNVFSASSSPHTFVATAPLANPTIFQRWNTRIENLAGFEARGIARVPPEERQAPSLMGYIQMLLLWFSANMSINNLAVGLCGPLVYSLGFTDSALCAVFGAFFGAFSTAYMATWGAESGNRTMVVARYFMGYYPAKITTLLNIILMLGYCTIDCIIGGQVLSAVSGGNMTIAVGVIVVAVIVCIIAVFGLAVFHVYERYVCASCSVLSQLIELYSFAWLPQLIVLFVLVGCAGPSFDTSLQSVGSASAIAANRLSFFSLCLYLPNSWAAAASDFYVYYPENTTKWKIFALTFAGLTLSFSFVNMLGVGLASGVAVNQTWSDAYAVSSGALITAGYSPLHGFGKFCAVIVALGVIANNVPGKQANPFKRLSCSAFARVVLTQSYDRLLLGRTGLPNHGPLRQSRPPLDLGCGACGHSTRVRARRPQPALHHLHELPCTDGLLAHDHGLHRPRRTPAVQASPRGL